MKNKCKNKCKIKYIYNIKSKIAAATAAFLVIVFALPAYSAFLPGFIPVDIPSHISTREAPASPLALHLDILGEIPFADIPSNIGLTMTLNRRFNEQFNAFVSANLASALYLDFSVDFYAWDEYFSIVMTKTATSASVFSAVSTTVIHLPTSRIISLVDIDPNAVGIVNGYIAEMVRSRPRGFTAGFSGIEADHPFYIANGELVIPFASAQMSPTQRGVTTLSFGLANLQTTVIDEQMYTVLPPNQYSAIMLHLSEVLQLFGYNIQWITGHSLSIYRNGVLVSELEIGQNSFSYEGSAPIELESAPILSERGQVLVPLSFFTQVMNIAIYLSPEGYIKMSQYNRDAQYDFEHGGLFDYQ